MSLNQFREQICTIAHLVYQSGLAAATDGNVSLRLNDGRFLISASATTLGDLAPEELVVINDRGEVVEGDRPASSERWMHLAAYDVRPDIRAVIHAHPPHCIALSMVGVELRADVLPDVVIGFEDVPTTYYATPGTEEGAGVIRDVVANRDAIILDRHGALTVGADLTAAWRRLEKLEQIARIYILALSTGRGIRKLDETQIKKLMAVRATYGIGKQK